MPLQRDEQFEEEYLSRRRRGNHGPILVAPTAPGPGGSGGSSGGSGTGGSSSKDGPGGKDSSSSSGSSSESNYRRKAGRRYLKQAANLQVQAQAIRHALNTDYGNALHAKLQDVNEILHDQNKVLMQGYRERVDQLSGAFDDNEKAAATQTTANVGNLARERSNALNQLAMQGAGESDAMAAQLMSLRNWQQNQSDIERSRFDTLRSINSSLTDLNVDTHTARVNNVLQAQADKSQLWTNYYNQRAEAYTNLGNTYGQMADYRDMAKEMGVGSGGGTGRAGGAFMAASHELGKSWDQPGISKKLLRWHGRDDFEIEKPRSLSAQLRSAPSVDLGQAPEGASLRKW